MNTEIFYQSLGCLYYGSHLDFPGAPLLPDEPIVLSEGSIEAAHMECCSLFDKFECGLLHPCSLTLSDFDPVLSHVPVTELCSKVRNGIAECLKEFFELNIQDIDWLQDQIYYELEDLRASI